MTDKTDDDIDDVLVKLAYKHKLQNELTYEKGTYCVDYPTFNYAHLFKDIKQLFIEQACEAASNYLMTKTSLDVESIVDAEKAIRDRFEGERPKEIKPNTKNLLRRFFKLSMSDQRNITRKLGIIENTDIKITEFERYKKVFIDIKERGLIEQLADEVGKLEQA